jgi:hypothetical protein
MVASGIGLLIELCGLSQREAAVYLKVSHDTVRSWSSGRNTTPDQAVERMRELYKSITVWADKTLAKIEKVPADVMVIRLPIPETDEDVIQRYKLPFLSAYLKVAALVCANSTRKVIMIKAK